MRASSKSYRDEEEFEQAEQEIHCLVAGHSQQTMDLVFFDETGFSLRPYIPYGWTPPGEVIEIPSVSSQRLNVLGFWNLSGEFYWQSQLGKVDATVVVEAFEGFCGQLQRETVVVLDNAPMHTGEVFQSHQSHWQQQGLYLYYLPTYSPELNWIEMLWRKIKYQWLPINAYESFESLTHEVENILDQVGKQYQLEIKALQYT